MTPLLGHTSLLSGDTRGHAPCSCLALVAHRGTKGPTSFEITDA